MSDYDALLLRVEHQDAEIERLRADYAQLQAALDPAAEALFRGTIIEECAQLVETKYKYEAHIARAIRALKDKP